MSATTQPTASAPAEGGSYRWLQLLMGIVCMAMIANLQYGWTLFVNPINKATGWSIAARRRPSRVASGGRAIATVLDI